MLLLRCESLLLCGGDLLAGVWAMQMQEPAVAGLLSCRV
jgi:hypothetical protein